MNEDERPLYDAVFGHRPSNAEDRDGRRQRKAAEGLRRAPSRTIFEATDEVDTITRPQMTSSSGNWRASRRTPRLLRSSDTGAHQSQLYEQRLIVGNAEEGEQFAVVVFASPTTARALNCRSDSVPWRSAMARVWCEPGRHSRGARMDQQKNDPEIDALVKRTFALTPTRGSLRSRKNGSGKVLERP